jgi:3'-phosphoadenosine 5'-phosphosulfate sulfotransferase (PAPS reductase)/FAD synthetase
MPIPKEMLWQWAQLPQFKRKVENAKEVIAEALAIANNPCVAVSWGKDSIAMMDLVRSVRPDIFCYCIGDSLEDMQDNYSEVRAKYKARHPLFNYQTLFYTEEDEGGFFKVVKKIGEDFDLTFLGCRAQESKGRRMAIKKFGITHTYKSGKHRCFPLAWWDSKDVWGYLVSQDLPYLHSYDAFGMESRTAVVHNFDLHRGKHQEYILASQGAMLKLKIQAPEYFELYRTLYPEVSQYV